MTDSAQIAITGCVLAASGQLNDFTQSSLAGHGRHSAASFMIVAHRSVLLASLATALILDASVLSVLAGGALATSAIALLWMPRLGEGGPVLEAARTSHGYLFAAIASNLNQFEPLVLSSLVGGELVGFYVIASRLVNPLTIFAGALGTIAVPDLATRESPSQRWAQARVYLAVAAIYSLVLVALAPVIATLALMALGDGYAGAGRFLMAVVVGAALSSVAQGLQALLIAEGRPAQSAWGVTAGALAALAGLAVLAVGGRGSLIWLVPPVSQLAVVFVLACFVTRGPTIRGRR